MPGRVDARVVRVFLLQVEASHAGTPACHMVNKFSSERPVPLCLDSVSYLQTWEHSAPPQSHTSPKAAVSDLNNCVTATHAIWSSLFKPDMEDATVLWALALS